MKFQVVIPARYASSRFPGKPLAEIGGKPMVVHVCERAAQSGAAAVHDVTLFKPDGAGGACRYRR